MVTPNVRQAEQDQSSKFQLLVALFLPPVLTQTSSKLLGSIPTLSLLTGFYIAACAALAHGEMLYRALHRSIAS